MVKNINSTHRVEGINTQFALEGANAAAKVKQAANKVKGAAGSLGETVKNALKVEE